MIEIFAQLGIDWRLLLAQVVNFAILFYVLRRFAYKPVLNALDARRERIANAEEKAKQAEEQAEVSEEEKEEMLKEARQQSVDIIAAAEADAEQQKVKILAEAEKERQKIEEEGRKKLDEERDKLRRELKGEMADLVESAVRKTVSDFADEQATKQLTSEALEILNAERSQTS